MAADGDACLVTGGAGFIGSHVAESLAKAGRRVVVLDDLSGGFVENVPAGVKFVEGSILDRNLIETLFTEERFRFVFHLAAYAAEGLSHYIKRYNYENNLIGSVNLINASVNHKVEAFVFTSSIAVYGSNQVPMTESLTPIPEDPYGIAKLAVESELRVTHEIFGLDYVIFRPHNVYGERQNLGDRYRNVVGIFMNNLMSGRPMPIFGDGRQSRAFTHIDDVAPLIARAVDVPAARNQVFNVGSDHVCDVNELATAVAGAMNVPRNVTHVPGRNEVKHAYSSHERQRAVFGGGEPVSLQAGLERMAAWARRVGSRRTRPFTAIEIAEGLPEVWRSEVLPTSV